jgi:adenosylcobinamide-phosphate guanylyltransferase
VDLRVTDRDRDRDRNRTADAGTDALRMDALVMCGGRGTRLRGVDEGTRDGDDTRSADGGDVDAADDGSGTATPHRERRDVAADPAADPVTVPADAEKPLVEVGGRPMVDRVVGTLRASDRVGTVHAVTSSAAPATAARVRELGLPVHEGTGEGYVADLTAALEAIGRPVLTAVADLPLLAPVHVDRTVAAAHADDRDPSGGVASVLVAVPAALARSLGVRVDTAFERAGREVVPTGLNVAAEGPDAVRLSFDARLAVNVNRPSDLALARALASSVDAVGVGVGTGVDDRDGGDGDGHGDGTRDPDRPARGDATGDGPPPDLRPLWSDG